MFFNTDFLIDEDYIYIPILVGPMEFFYIFWNENWKIFAVQYYPPYIYNPRVVYVHLPCNFHFHNWVDYWNDCTEYHVHPIYGYSINFYGNWIFYVSIN